MRVRLRAIEESDLVFLNMCRNKYSVSKDLYLYLPKSMASEKEWFSKSRDEIHFLIEVGDDTPVGQVSLIHVNNKERAAEFTIFLDDAHWGRGYGTVATRLMLEYAFTELNFHKVFLHVYEGNDRAKKMYESVGLVQEGHLRDFVFKRGKFLSAYYMGILRNEFLEKEKSSGFVEPLLYDGEKLL